jgi:OOP family OmpA-OmpF porin
VVQQTIAGLPDGYEASTAIQAPPAPNLTLTYDGNSGLNATGNLPGDLTAAEIASALAVQDTSITVENDADGDKLALLDPVLGLGAWIGELESAKLTIADEQVEVVAETLPAADLDLVRKGLGEALGDIASLEVTTTSATYPDGHRRRNQLTGLEEEHQSGFWLPVLNFETGLDTCQDQTDLALAARKVAFLTGSSKLDVSARAAINSLAGVIRRCVADTATLKLEIGGHTDSQGSDVNNQRLSEARAQAVREALVGRGVPADRVEAVGYGETQPVADNGTAEGRAQNRRTEIRWIAE